MILNKEHETSHQEWERLRGEMSNARKDTIWLDAVHFISRGSAPEVSQTVHLNAPCAGISLTISEARELAEALTKMSDWLELKSRNYHADKSPA